MQMRMNRQYGAGMKSLRTSLSQSAASDPVSRAVNGKNDGDAYLVNNWKIYPHDWQSFPLGVVSGLQYDNNTFGSCFYAVADTLNFVQFFKEDWVNFVTTFAFYPLFVYDPIRLLSNYLALYE